MIEQNLRLSSYPRISFLSKWTPHEAKNQNIILDFSLSIHQQVPLDLLNTRYICPLLSISTTLAQDIITSYHPIIYSFSLDLLNSSLSTATPVIFQKVNQITSLTCLKLWWHSITQNKSYTLFPGLQSLMGLGFCPHFWPHLILFSSSLTFFLSL